MGTTETDNEPYIFIRLLLVVFFFAFTQFFFYTIDTCAAGEMMKRAYFEVRK